MAQPFATPDVAVAVSRPRGGLRSAVVWGGAGLAALLLIAALALWFRYGTAVFFETIATGFANCF
jgi:hypothetical protein